MSDSQYGQEWDESQQGTQDAEAGYSTDEDQYAPADDDPGWSYTDPRDHLIHWAENVAPDAGSWTWEGWGDGGYVLACHNGMNWQDADWTVRFHLHPQEFHSDQWLYGSMWIEGVQNVSINLSEDVRTSALLDSVATTLWDANAEARQS